MTAAQTFQRSIARIVTPPAPGPGFAGPQHTAAPVIDPRNFAATDPFILLMDDRISTAGPIGEEHPHAGIETVTFVLTGIITDVDGTLGPGDVEWMTAGSGIVHSEATQSSDDMRLLQLWIVLPKAVRWTAPIVNRLRGAAMPVRREPGVEARVYGGRSGEAVAPTANAVPATLVDVRLRPGAAFTHELDAADNGFAFVLDGAVEVAGRRIEGGQVGWLDRPAAEGASVLTLSAGADGARVLLYAGRPLGTPVAARGPFVAGSDAELAQFFAAYRRGSFPRASDVRLVAA